MAAKKTVLLLLVVAVALTSIIMSPAKGGTVPSPFITLRNNTHLLPSDNPFYNTDMEGTLMVFQGDIINWLWMEVHELMIPYGGVIDEHPIVLQHSVDPTFTLNFMFQAEMVDESNVVVGNAYAFEAAEEPPETEPQMGGLIGTHPLNPVPKDFNVYAYGSLYLVGDGTISVEPVEVDIEPDTLNLASNGKWITAYIEVPGFNPSEIDVSSIRLNETFTVDPEAPTTIGDHDSDGVEDLMVKFDRESVLEWLGTQDYGEDTGKSVEVALTITGEVMGVEPSPFECSDTVKVLLKG